VPHIHAEKLLSDLLCWEQEKEDNHNKAKVERDLKIEAIKAERIKVKAAAVEKARIALEKKRKQMLENGEGEPEEAVPEKEVEVEAEAAEGEEGEEGAKPKVLSARSEKEEPINVKLEGDSDDEFCAIEIKEKIREFITTNGKDARIPDDLINEAVRWRLNRNDC